MSIPKQIWVVWAMVILAEVIPVVIFGKGIKIPVFAGLASGVIFGIMSIWPLKRFEQELIAAATGVTLISIVAGVTGHTSGGGLLMFVNQLLLCLWGCIRIWKERYDLLILSILFPMLTLGVVVEIAFHNQFYLPPNFTP